MEAAGEVVRTAHPYPSRLQGWAWRLDVPCDDGGSGTTFPRS